MASRKKQEVKAEVKPVAVYVGCEPDMIVASYKRGVIDGTSRRCPALFEPGNPRHGYQTHYDEGYQVGATFINSQIDWKKDQIKFSGEERKNF